ncbi:MAG: hypothetical protein HYT47_00110 [Candidatus Vogelbacteria bacterium]|nr:hypothetical protein [Candidatus Vogelbacteria bacterium]
MAGIVPAIIGQNFSEIEEKIKLLERWTDWVHLDIMDGTFTDQKSWRTPDDLELFDAKIDVEVHLMVEKPETVLGNWIHMVDQVIVHVEATEYLEKTLDYFTLGAATGGLAINLNTPIAVLEPWLQNVKLVQLMAIAEIGEQGHPFDERVLEKIKILRSKHPNVKIQIDGGVNLVNAEKLIAAGADNLVVGSAIWQSPDPIAALKKFYAFTRRQN